VLTQAPRTLAPLLVVGLGTALLSLAVVRGPLVSDIRAELEEARMPAEQRVVILEKMGGSWGYASAMIPPVGSVALVFVAAGVLGALLAVARAVRPGPRVPYRTLVSVTAHVWLIDLLEFALKLPLMLAKGTLHVYSSLALLLPEDAADTRLFDLLNAVDAFTIWKLTLFTIAIAIVAGRTRAEAALVAWLPWGAFVLLKVALHGLLARGVAVG
jgi:hypothetical protein